jgi:hypothetical protein
MFDLETERKHTPEPDLVPILDGLTAVIFFLLLSISFVGLTKVTMPPSVASVASPSQETPLSARLKATLVDSNIQLKLEWIGKKPGSLREIVIRQEPHIKNQALIVTVKKMTSDFKAKYPDENTLQLALSETLSYQEMISMMDGALGQLKDIALSSYDEANAMDQGSEE